MSRHKLIEGLLVAGLLAAMTTGARTSSLRVGEIAESGAAAPGPRAAAEAPGVDVVQLRILRMETRRWQKLGESSIPEEDTFNDWAFGGEEGARRFRRQLYGLLDRKIREVRQLHALTPVQERKLRLAGTGDLQRLLDLVEDAHREFERARTDTRRLVQLQTDLRLVELRVTEDPFGLGSLFSKTLWKMQKTGELVPKRRTPSGG